MGIMFMTAVLYCVMLACFMSEYNFMLVNPESSSPKKEMTSKRRYS